MELMKNVELKYEDGKAKLEIDVKPVVLAEIEKIETKIASGEIDLIPGTELDKILVGQILAAVKALV